MICNQGVGTDSRKFPMKQFQTMTFRLGFYPNLGKMNLLADHAPRDKTMLEIKVSSPNFSAQIFSLVKDKVNLVMAYELLA